MNIFNVNVPKDSLSMIFDEFNGVENYNTTLYLHKSKIVYDEELVEEVFGTKNPEELKEKIWQEVKKVNKTMPAYKYIRDIIVTEQDLIKTTTQKIKRFEEIKTVS